MRSAGGPNSPPVVAVVGGGFSGLLTAIQLLRADPRVRVRLVERAPRLGAGRAYATANPDHLLNVRAANMSAFPDRPGHFLDWLGEAGDGDAFVSRGRYGDYLQHVLDAELQDLGAGLRLVRKMGEAVEAGPDGSGWRVRLAHGHAFLADAVVLATGFPPAAWPEGIDGEGLTGPTFVADPWASDLVKVPRGEVLLIGSGLTMVDVALSLAGPGRRLTALSRRGLLSLSHGPAPPAPPPPLAQATPLAALRRLREHARKVGWRSAVDSVRPLAPALWRFWPIEQRRRFLRHLRPWWDVHRHRMAPVVAERLSAMRAWGVLTLEAGRIVSLRAVEGGVEALIRPRGGAAAQTRRFDAVVNCAGPAGDPRSVREGVIADLREGGWLRADALGLGLDVDANLRVIGADGTPSRGLYAVGPLTRSAVWEAVAVPDLRGQTAEIAATVLADLGLVGGASAPTPAPPGRAAGEARAESQAFP